MGEINWLDNKAASCDITPGVYTARLLKVGDGERVSLSEGVRARTVTLVFEVLPSGVRLRRTFTHRFDKESQLSRFVLGMLSEEEKHVLADPFVIRRTLRAQVGRSFQISCSDAETSGWLEVTQAVPLDGDTQ